MALDSKLAFSSHILNPSNFDRPYKKTENRIFYEMELFSKKYQTHTFRNRIRFLCIHVGNHDFVYTEKLFELSCLFMYIVTLRSGFQNRKEIK